MAHSWGWSCNRDPRLSPAVAVSRRPGVRLGDMAILPRLPLGCLLVRTDFSSDEAWLRLADEALAEYPDGFGEVFAANIEPINDPAFSGATWQAVRAAVPPDDDGASVLFIADATTLASPDHPILAVDLLDDPDNAPFRCIPSELWSVEANINIANMDWADFADEVDDDGVFRGFPDVP